MRILIALTVFAFACGGSKPKKESALVETSDQTPQCCCKTLPKTAEKEIVPEYTTKERMECSAANGDCVDEVQCNAAPQEAGTQQSSGTGADGVPPPPNLDPAAPPVP